MRIVYMGTPEFAVAPLKYLLLNGFDVVAVYTQPDRPAGRGRGLGVSAVKKAALDSGLPVLHPVSLKDAAVLARLADLRPDVIVVAAYGLLLPPAVLELPRYQCVNIHPSLLPRHRGAAPVAGAIMAGDGFTGVSIMLMDRGWDTGAILAQAQIPVMAQDTTGSLTPRLSLVAAQLLPEVLIHWAGGTINPRPQNNDAATYSGTISKEDGQIDWQTPVADIARHVRAFQPWPGCYTCWQGKQLKIIEAVPLPADDIPSPGQVLALPPESGAVLGITAGGGILEIRCLQLAGKRAVAAVDFLRGQRQLIGAVLPS